MMTQSPGASRRGNADAHPHRCLTFESVWTRRIPLTLPWRGRVVSHRAKQDAIRGGVTVYPIEQCPCGEITPPRFAFRFAQREPTLPLQGRVNAPRLLQRD